MIDYLLSVGAELLVCQCVYRLFIVIFLEQLCQSRALDPLEVLILSLCHELVTYIEYL